MASKSITLRKRALDVYSSQAGVISRSQLLGLGYSSAGITGRVKSSQLHRIYWAAYSVAREVERESVWWAGVLSAGVGSVLSHMSALHAWGISTHSGPTEVTRLTSSGRPPKSARPSSRAGSATLVGHSEIPVLQIHHSRSLVQEEITTCRGIPVTTVARTFIDVAGRLGEGQLRSLLHEASRNRLLRFGEMRTAMDRSRGKKGLRKLRKIIDGWDPQTSLTRNGLEKLVLRLCRRGDLPTPLVNRIVAGREVDFLFEEFGLILEVDGGRDHNSPHGIERDKDKDSFLQLRGFRILRLTRYMLEHEPEKSMQKIRDHLALCRAEGRRADPGWATASIGHC